MKPLQTVLMVLLSVVLTNETVAVLHDTDDPSIYSSAPTGELAASGWEFQGQFNSYLGTPIAPHHFITAKHIGGSVGHDFHYNGEVFNTIAKTDDPDSDLRLWEIDGTFEQYAPLYNTSDESGKNLVVFGRGVDRGAVVTNSIINDPPGPRPPEIQVITNGWKWGAYTYVQRWGENAVSATTTINGNPVLKADWDTSASEHECMLTDKDSGGAVFIEQNGVWKLAGINFAIGPSFTYSLSADGSDSFNGSILDFTGGVYAKAGELWVLQLPTQKSAFYSTRISSRYSWITNNIPDFDSDVDGLPDHWENSTGVSEPDEDPDKDGFSNYEEWICDTDPNLENSYLQLLAYTQATSLGFTSSADRQYRIEYSTNLLNPNWQTSIDWFEGSLSQTVYAVATTGSNRYYRVQVKLR